jgi:5-dehydro-2-deoxygluconokinase
MRHDRAPLDVITIGRSSVDLYGQQVGGRLEDMASFSKAVGGCPANIAIGTARLGLKSALISRVGDEHMGRFIREQLLREGVNGRGWPPTRRRLTALVVLGVRDDKTFPLIFYRSDCADAALDESDIDEAFIASARAIVVTGTHFAGEHGQGADEGDPAGKKTWPQGRVRCRLPAQPLGAGRPWRRRGALHPLGSP